MPTERLGSRTDPLPLLGPGQPSLFDVLRRPPVPLARANVDVAAFVAPERVEAPVVPTTLGQKLAAAGTASIDARMRAHNESIDRSGVGTYYGDHSTWQTMTDEARSAWLDAHMTDTWKSWPREQREAWAAESLPDFATLTPEAQAQWLSADLAATRGLDAEQKQQYLFDNLLPWAELSDEQREAWLSESMLPGAHGATQLKQGSCIGWVMENVGAAYKATGQGERWAEIVSIVRAGGMKGTDLAIELQKDGWQAIYWNPDVKNPSDGDAEHRVSAANAKRGKPYYGIDIDALVLNYRPSGQGDPPTTQDLSGIEKLKKVPFYFGLARGGRHTFVGRNAQVNEFHWAEMPDSRRAIQESPLQAWGWNSGVIMVPPGTWPTS